MKYTGKSRGFVWGNCTYFVAMNKTVTWRGNAKEWLRNAAKQGVPTGSVPATGAIVVFNGHGYNPYYGHVGIVLEVHDDYIIVKDMNYRALNEVTVRKVLKNEAAIKGYIYVD
ncbi:MAG TPA: CHAP domain-containing protein [bacterium]|nr:CHAP domain-containing protein [bacterium]